MQLPYVGKPIAICYPNLQPGGNRAAIVTRVNSLTSVDAVVFFSPNAVPAESENLTQEGLYRLAELIYMHTDVLCWGFQRQDEPYWFDPQVIDAGGF